MFIAFFHFRDGEGAVSHHEQRSVVADAQTIDLGIAVHNMFDACDVGPILQISQGSIECLGILIWAGFRSACEPFW